MTGNSEGDGATEQSMEKEVETQTPDSATPKRRHPLRVTLGALAIVALASTLPLPGLFQDSLAQLFAAAGHSSSLFEAIGLPLPALALTALGLHWLLILRGLGALLGAGPGRPRLRRFLLLAYLMLSGLQAFTLALWSETALGAKGEPMVISPGWSYRLMFTLTLLAGAALLWMAASWITRAGLGSGPLTLTLASFVVSFLPAVYRAGEIAGFDALASAQPAPLRSALLFIHLLPLLIMALALWRIGGGTYPFRLIGPLSLKGPSDLLGLSCLLWVGFGEQTLGTEDSRLAGMGTLLLVVAGVLFVAWIVLKRRRDPGARRGSPAPLFATLLLGLCAVLFYWQGLGSAAVPPPSEPASSLRGDQNVTLHLESKEALTGAQRQAAVQSILLRLQALGLKASAEQAKGSDPGPGVGTASKPGAIAAPVKRSLALRLQAIDLVRLPGLMKQVLAPMRFSVQLVALDQGATVPGPELVLPPNVTRRQGAEGVPFLESGAVATLLAVLPSPPPSLGSLAAVCMKGQRWSYGAQAGEHCRAVALDSALIKNDAISELNLGRDSMHGGIALWLKLKESASLRLAELSRLAVGRRLALVLDGRVLSMPTLRGPLKGRSLKLLFSADTGAAEDPLPSSEQARLLQSALSSPPLAGEWQLLNNAKQ